MLTFYSHSGEILQKKKKKKNNKKQNKKKTNQILGSNWKTWQNIWVYISKRGERGGSVVECRTPEREVRGSRPTAAVLCPWARHFTPRKYWLITQEAMAPSRHDWKIVDWDVKPQHNQHNQPTYQSDILLCIIFPLWTSNTINFFLLPIVTPVSERKNAVKR